MVIAFVKRYKVEIAISLFLVALYFASRLLTLLSLPIFTDEAIYIRWAQIAKNDANWRFIALTDGKQPLFIWFMIVAMKFIQDPLVAGRIISVFAGFGTMIGLFFLGREMFKNYWVGLWSAGLYAIYSFSLVYDRMALYDGLVGTFAVWGLYLAVLLSRTLRLDVALITGMVGGAAALNKTSGFFNVYLLPVSLLLLNWRAQGRVKQGIRWTGLAVIVAALTFGMYSLLRLSPFFHIIEAKNALFIYPFHEWIQHPFLSFYGNLFVGMQDWLIRYMTIPFLIMVIAAFLLDRRFLREKTVLFLWFFVPFILLALFGHRLYPRYIFFMTLPLLPLIAFSIWRMKELIFNRLVYSIMILFVVSLQFRNDYAILYNFAYAPIPVSDVGQYNNAWPSGTGVKESVAFFQKEAEKGKIFIATEGTFGLMPYAYEIYLDGHPNIEIKGYWPIPQKPPAELIEKSKTMPVYFVFYQGCYLCKIAGLAPETWVNAAPVLQVPKVEPNNYLTVYQITP